jgi:hypothetical protein
MAAYKVVRFQVKPDRDEDFLDAHRPRKLDWPGMRKLTIIKTGERSYCLISEWDTKKAMAAAQPHMDSTLDTVRDMLEDLDQDLGVTDVSGPVVLEGKASRNTVCRRRASRQSSVEDKPTTPQRERVKGCYARR